MAETLSVQGVLGAAQEVVRLSVPGMGGVGIQIQGTYSGTIAFEVSIQGQEFVSFLVTPPSSTVAVTSTAATGMWVGAVVGALVVRVRMSSYTSGEATVFIRAEQASPSGSGSGGGGGAGAVTVADGADTTEGTIGDPAVTGDNAGTISAKLRGLNKILASVWDSINGRLKVDGSAVTQPISAAGTIRTALPQLVDAGNSGALVGVTTQRTVLSATVTGSRTVTSAGLFLSSDLGSALEGTGIPANAIIVKFTSTSSVDFQAAPSYPSNPNPSATATGSPVLTVRVGFAGTFTSTRAANIVRQLVVVGANVYSGLGATFCFQYGEDGTTAVISEVRAIGDFAVVRDFDLINAGAYFRILVAPSRILIVPSTSEVLFYNTTNRTQDDGAFVRLANQEIEESNAAMGHQFAYQKAFDPNTGKSVNIRPGAVVTSNSSTTPLAGAASFNASGTYFSLDNIGGITVSVTTDQSGTLFVDNAVDSVGAQVLRTSSFAVTGGTAFFIGLSPLGRFMRIRYTNGATLQTSFLLQTNTKTTAISQTFQRSDTALSDASILANTRAILSGRGPDGNYRNTPANLQGNLITADFLTEVAKGNVANHTLVNRFGYNAALGNTTSTIWQAGGVYAFPGTAAVVSGVSSSVNDAAAGTGARTVLIEGLNSAYVAISETITLTGIVAVVTTASFFRIDRITVVTAGSTASNVGTLTFTILGVTVGLISPTFNITSSGIYTVAAAFTAYLLDANVSQTNQNAASLSTSLWTTSGASLLFQRKASVGGHSQGGAIVQQYIAPLVFAEKSDMRFDSISSAAANGVHLNFNILLVGN